jgi:hypothetical protein
MSRMILLHNLKKRKSRREEFETENAIILTILAKLMEDELNIGVRSRSASFYRKRWDSAYLRDLAERENSFVSEYRLGPKQFDILHEIISPA